MAVSKILLSADGYNNILDAAAAAEIAAGPAPILSSSVGGSRALILTDSGAIIELGGTIDWVVVIPTDTSVNFPVGTIINFTKTGTGLVSIMAATGVILNGVDAGTTTIFGQWAGASIYKRAAYEWVVQGSLSGAVV